MWNRALAFASCAVLSSLLAVACGETRPIFDRGDAAGGAGGAGSSAGGEGGVGGGPSGDGGQAGGTAGGGAAGGGGAG
ncbi:hypothetical protein WMF04_22485 [Sorangium sp. So ce260]|uniref:hypothetical protein n=1 Tax=Sorangium sp. So ce260 TaxID=3133291 RepID=UPI003F621C82